MKRLLVVGMSPGFALPKYISLQTPGSDYAVTLLISVPAGWSAETITHSDSLCEHHVPRSELYAEHDHSARFEEALRRTFLTLAADADVIVHTTSVLFDVDERCGVDGKLRIYDTGDGPEYEGDFPVHVTELRAVSACDQVVASSEEARLAFRRWYDCPPEKLTQYPDMSAPARRVEPAVRRRRHVVYLNDYRLDTPGGGGHIRMRELCSRVTASEAQVTLICFSDAAVREYTVLAPHFQQIAIPKTETHRHLQASVDALHNNSAADVTSLVSCAENTEMEQEFRAALLTADLVVFEHVYMAPLAGLVPEHIPIVYTAQNVETTLKADIYETHPQRAALAEAVRLAEEDLVSRAAAIICVSRDDAEHFRALTNRPVHVIENGVRLMEESGDSCRAGSVVFIGSAHPPNIESVQFILNEVAPALPDVPFVIIGSVKGALDAMVRSGTTVPPNVTFTGVIDLDAKEALLRESRVGLNPMFSGGGSNLKLPDYFAARLPVLSTPFGARGFDVEDSVHLRIAPADQFTATLQEMLANPSRCELMAEAAYEYTRDRLSWDVLGNQLRALFLGSMGSRDRAMTFWEDDNSVFADNGRGMGRTFALHRRATTPERGAQPPSMEEVQTAAEFARHLVDPAAEDAALRSCSATCPELERYLTSYGQTLDKAMICTGPRSALRRGTRMLQLTGVPTFVHPHFDAANPDDHWLSWYDTLAGATGIAGLGFNQSSSRVVVAPHEEKGS